MALMDIATELKLLIASYLAPRSSFRFAITCKRNWSLCDSLIQTHTRRLAEYQKIDATRTGRLVWTKLKEILEDPSQGWYVRELNLPSGRQTYWDPTWRNRRNNNQTYEEPLEEDLAICRAAAQKLRNLYPGKMRDLFPKVRSWREDWGDEADFVSHIEDMIAFGSEEGILAVLVHHLPMLKVLRVTDSGMSEGTFKRLLQLVALGYGDPARAPLMPFQRLEAAAVAHWDSEMSCSPEWALHLNCIPSLRRFAASSMGGRLDDRFYRGGKLPKSNVKELFFENSQFHAKALGEILKSIEGLEKFTYSGGGPIISEDASFTPKRVLKALAKYQGHSLRELFIHHFDLGNESEDADLKRVDLRSFRQLKQLRCDWIIICSYNAKRRFPAYYRFRDRDSEEEGNEEEEENSLLGFRIKDLLPESLETLRLCHFGRGSDDAKRQLEDFKQHLNTPEPKNPLPNLKTVHFVTNRTEGAQLWDDPLNKLLEGHGYM